MADLKMEIPEDELIDQEVIEGILELDDGDCDLLAELVEEFATNFRTDSPKLLKYINAEEFKEVNSTAHKLKGAAANLGMKHFSKIAYEIEQTGKKMNLEGAVDIIPELNHSFTLTIKYFKGFFSEHGLEFSFEE